jgi:hypothetical protein
MTELDVYRNVVAPEFLLRWTRVECPQPHCMTHHMGIVGFKLATPPSMNWFVPIVNVVGPEPEFVEVEVARAEKKILAKPDESIDGWRLAAAAYGQPWESLTTEKVWLVYGLLADITPKVGSEMHEQGVEGLLTLRRWVGRNTPASMPAFLLDLARYRANVGGEHKELDLG